jgi:hypothetical protein
MIDLIKAFSIEQILLFIVMLALGVKGLIDFIDWVKSKNSDRFKKDYRNIKKSKDLEDRQKIVEEKLELYHKYADTLDRRMNDITETMNENFRIINAALMHDIKQWIIDQHSYYMEEGWISIVQLDMIEARYKDYVALGGNSIIPTLMKELRDLPKHK